ncbi:TerC family protein [uncultured Thiothrix sp.]|uniref:TerC family protein n=1 Tax=uncultured Thiothrix sp. TaxID=223185 RepID=UPI002623281F|nr:TerC family protein [uncultured Thiothrix sp.]
MELLLDINVWSAFLTLTLLEIVLGIDNIIFLTLMVNRLPPEQRALARKLGLFGAMISRVLLLLSIAWVAKLVEPLFTIMGHAVSGRDLVLVFGGLFLIYKAVTEIHGSLEGGVEDGESAIKKGASTFMGVIAQIAVIDIVFSLDSVITAIGLADQVFVMVAAIVVAILVMMFAAGPIGDFVEAHPTVKMLALTFLVLVGVVLVAEGTGHEVPKGYLYFAMAFSFGVEMLNMKMRKNSKKVVDLHDTMPQKEQDVER